MGDGLMGKASNMLILITKLPITPLMGSLMYKRYNRLINKTLNFPHVVDGKPNSNARLMIGTIHKGIKKGQLIVL